MATQGATERSLVYRRICSGSRDVRDLPDLPQRWTPLPPRRSNLSQRFLSLLTARYTVQFRAAERWIVGERDGLRRDGHEERNSLLYL